VRRLHHPPRIGWEEKVEEYGLIYHTHEGAPYWHEAGHYELSGKEAAELEAAAEAVFGLCTEALDLLADGPYRHEFGLPEWAFASAQASWKRREAALYGRFDLAFDGSGPPKLLEFNADTPTALLEAAVVQWQWAQEFEPGCDQFNLIWELLVARFQSAFARGLLHFAHQDCDEDAMTVALLRDAAESAGIETAAILLEDIGWDSGSGCFVDLELRPIRSCFKLYPWESLVRDRFGRKALEADPPVAWIEPPWKALLSSKAILPELWRIAPGHENLLPASFEPIPGAVDWVSKPVHSREGAGVTIALGGQAVESTPREKEHQAMVYQAYAPLFRSDAGRAVMGVWMIDDEPAGLGVRESDGRITTDLSRFVPHILRS
jgi:glutathionylspermidine synthase